MHPYKPGDWIVYHKPKVSAHPGPRAADVDPAPRGELYAYHVDKFWVVSRIVDAGTIEARTRTGKTHRIRTDDARLTPAGWLHRLRFRARFLEAAAHLG